MSFEIVKPYNKSFPVVRANVWAIAKQGRVNNLSQSL